MGIGVGVEIGAAVGVAVDLGVGEGVGVGAGGGSTVTCVVAWEDTHPVFDAEAVIVQLVAFMKLGAVNSAL